MTPSRISPAVTVAALTLLATGSAIGPAVAAQTGRPSEAAEATATLAVDRDGRSLTYRAAAGQANDLQITAMPGGPDVRRIAFNDEVTISAGAPCTQPDPGDPTRVVCELPADSAPADDIRVLLGDGDDAFFTVAPGVSVVQGGADDDELHAHSAHTVLGGDGDDMLMGGVVMRGDAGMDHLMGDDRDQYLWGGSGDDHVEAYGGDDVVSADSGDDHVVAGEGDDVVFGGRDDDMLMGEAGRDVLHGGSGDDTLDGGAGTDLLWGGAGTDEITQ
ncbi:calcium-binding protein [Streptomyces sp. 8K308]|uniref:calcium-binding protein n=1 Tax=Streptomyces sp. 8K308 TaxID=2530388 RepID=UPI0010527699|nr:calcium-binding protein [Streptomyces sp. 8K308]TDC27721.1 calcium-binding protein [Streptomyces sp. 8K308]